MVNTDQGRWTD